jgi:nucleoside-diphosphate-sugar epimerase
LIELNDTLRDKRILVTGASGWIGQEFLCQLQSSFGSLNRLNLTCAASKQKTILIHGEAIDCKSLNTITPSTAYDLIIHLAFVLPNPTKQITTEDYINTNQIILSLTKNLFDQNQNALKLIMSSGAAMDSNEFTRSDILKNYGLLKQNMESTLGDSNSLLVRLWSATGHHLPLDGHYALADFFRKARLDQDILIQNNVLRSYIYVQELLHLAIDFLYRGGRGIVNSGGFTVSLSELADIMVKAMNSKSRVYSKELECGNKLDYISPESNLTSKNIEKLSTIELQVSKMIEWI